MKTPKRCPVMYEEYLMNSIGVCWSNIKNKDVRFQMNLLAELLQEEINKKLGRKVKKEEKKNSGDNLDVRRFIAVFRDRYAREVDLEYKSQISPDEIGMIKALLKKFLDKNVDFEDYLDWVFDDFFEKKNNVDTFSPTIKFVCGSFLSSKFFFINRDKLRKRAMSVETKSRRETIRSHGKILFRKTKDKMVRKWLEWESEKTISTEDLEDYLKKFEKKMEEI